MDVDFFGHLSVSGFHFILTCLFIYTCISIFHLLVCYIWSSNKIWYNKIRTTSVLGYFWNSLEAYYSITFKCICILFRHCHKAASHKYINSSDLLCLLPLQNTVLDGIISINIIEIQGSLQWKSFEAVIKKGIYCECNTRAYFYFISFICLV